MKKTLLPLALLCMLPLFYACRSTQLDLSLYTPVAIMTMYSNPGVPWYEERNGSNGAQQTDEGILTGAVNRMLNKQNPETATAQSRIDGASALFSERLRDAGIAVIDPTTLKNCTAYKNTGKTFFDYLGNTLPAAGYDALTSSNKRLNRAMCAESGAKSVLYVSFRFQKVLVKDGVRNKGVAARVVMQVYGTDDAGKKLINRDYIAVSADYAELVRSSTWDKEKLCALFPAAIARVITNFLLDFAPLAAPTQEATSAASTADASRTASTTESDESAPVAVDADNDSTASTDDSNAPAAATATNDSASAVQEEKRATAKKLLQRGMSAEEAADITGLPLEQVQQLE